MTSKTGTEPPTADADAQRARWRRVEGLFAEVVDLPEAERAVRLARAEDRALAAEVLDLCAVAGSAPEALRELVAREAARFSRRATGVAVGSHVDGYVIVGEIGEGGMGVVYLAERAGATEPRARVAIKVLTHASSDAVARFHDERRILATLDHPGIVRLLDGGRTASGLPYLVMEHVDGVPLTRFVRERRLDARERLALMLEVIAAVEHAHAQRVVHRDLKPSNILVTADGRTHLLDFGIAKLLDPIAAETLEARTRAGFPLLTPEYASPEQTRGGPVSIASDVYSLGAVLYEVLTGAPPIRTTPDPLELLRRIREVSPPRPSEVATLPGLADDLDDIVMKALAKDPGDRYASVLELATDLRRHLAGLPVTAQASVGARAVRLARRHRGALALIAALGVGAGALALVVGSPRPVSPAPTEPRVDVVPAPAQVPPDPEPRRIANDSLRPDAIVLRDAAGAITIVEPGPDGRVFHGDGRAGRLYEQPVVQRFADAASGRWTTSVWAPRVPHLEPGSVGRRDDGAFARWCGSDRETSLVEVTGDEARGLLARSTLFEPALVRMAYLLARDERGTYYYVDALRSEHGGGGHRVFVGAKRALTQRPLTSLAIDPAGDVFATASGDLRIVRRTPSAAPASATWIAGGEIVPLALLDVRANLALVYGELGVYPAFLGTMCDAP